MRGKNSAAAARRRSRAQARFTSVNATASLAADWQMLQALQAMTEQPELAVGTF